MTAPPDTRAAPPLRLLFWETTSRCNLSCRHCRRLDTDEPSARDDLSTDEARRMLDSAATLGRPVVVFSGGEPLLRDDWESLASHVRGLGLAAALATNGTLVDKPMAGRIARAGFHRVSISLDGADAGTHDEFRASAGAFDAAMDGIANLRCEGVAVQINSTIAAHNVDQLPQFYALARSVGATALHLFLLVPVGCGVQLDESHRISPDTVERVLNWVCERQAEGAVEIRATCAPHYYRVAAQRGLAVSPRARGCLAGTGVVFVSHRGEVFPCGYLPVSCGSVREKELGEIWRTSPVLAELRDPSRLGGKCGACGYRALCGGCRARALAATEDYLAADPACRYAPPRRGI
ncbi:MAG TPA: radical SAM protein [Phycisphaerae bacterium]|nr:radical SAM protein [Phycisphaerae bacterium]